MGDVKIPPLKLKDMITFEEAKESINLRNTTGITGVFYHKVRRKYVAQIMVDGKLIYLGAFVSLEEATKARKDAEIKYKYNANHGTNKSMYAR